jgi:hypothetical protein
MLFLSRSKGNAQNDKPRRQKTMPHSEPTLPSNRAFVVQFRVTSELTTDDCTGRIEHLVTGQSVRFDSWEHLQRFIQEMLTQVGEKPP